MTSGDGFGSRDCLCLLRSDFRPLSPGSLHSFDGLRILFEINLIGIKSKFTAVVRQEEDAYVAFTPDLDIASQGADPEEALSNLREAVALFLECAPPEELAGRLTQDAWITQFEAEYAST